MHSLRRSESAVLGRRGKDVVQPADVALYSADYSARRLGPQRRPESDRLREVEVTEDWRETIAYGNSLFPVSCMPGRQSRDKPKKAHYIYGGDKIKAVSEFSVPFR